MPEEIVAKGRGRHPAVYIPSQTSIGYEVIVPSALDAKELTRFLDKLGRGRVRVQPSFQLKAVELKWSPSGAMPGLPAFTKVVASWAQRKGYVLARDMRELRQGLEAVRTETAVLKVAARFEKVAQDKLTRALAAGEKLLVDLDVWVSRFPQVLRRAEHGAVGLPDGWVWQDEFVQYVTEYDDKFLSRFQDLDYDLEGLWAEGSGKASDIALMARKALKEPSGKAGVNVGFENFKFMPHPEKKEHIAYPVADLKAWAQAFAAWVTNGQRQVRALAVKAKKV